MRFDGFRIPLAALPGSAGPDDYAQTARCRDTPSSNISALARKSNRAAPCDNCRNPPYVEPAQQPAKHEFKPTHTARKMPDAPRPLCARPICPDAQVWSRPVILATTDQVAVLLPHGTTRRRAPTLKGFFARAARLLRSSPCISSVWRTGIRTRNTGGR